MTNNNIMQQIILLITLLNLGVSFRLTQQEQKIHDAILKKMSLTGCINLIPLAEQVVMGYDMSKYDASGFYQSFRDGIGRYQFVKITCNKNETWKNPFTNAIYQIPDQIAGPIKIQDHPPEIERTTYFNTYERLIEATAYVPKNNYLVGMFSNTNTMNKTLDSMLKGESFFQASTSIASSYTVSMAPVETLELSELAQFGINKMIQTYPVFNSTSFEFYNIFMDYFGTHIPDVIMGGVKYFQLATTANVFLTQSTYSDGARNAGFNILNFVDKTMGNAGSAYPTNKTWLTNSNIQTLCLGGLGDCPFSEQTYNRWKQSAVLNPWPFIMSVFPISRIMPKIIQASYDAAVENRFMKAYLNNVALPFLTYSLSAKYKVMFSDNYRFFDNYYSALYGFDKYALGSNINSWCSDRNIRDSCDVFRQDTGYQFINSTITDDYVLVSNQYACGKSRVIVITENLIRNATRLVSSDIIYDTNAFFKIANELPELFAIFADAVVPERINGLWGLYSNITYGWFCNYKQLSTSQTVVCDMSNAKYKDGINYLDKVLSYGKKYYNIKTGNCLEHM